MRLLTIIFLMLFCADVCDAQSTSFRSETEKKVLFKMDDLRSIKTDSIIHFMMQCNGSIVLVEDSSCSAQDVQYLLWSDHGVQFMQRFDECKNYKPIKTDRHFLDLVSRNYFKIKRENVKPPQFIRVDNGKKHLFSMGVDHSCEWMFKIHIGKQTVFKSIDNFDLTTDYINDGGKQRKNLNYQSNQRSILKQLTVDIEKVVKDYNDKIDVK